MGPSTSGTSMAAVPIVNKAKVPMIALGASSKIASPVEKRKWVFKVVPGDDLAVALMYEYMKKHGINKIGVLSVSTGYGISGREQLKNLAGQYGIEIVADETYGPKESDLTAQLTKVRGIIAEQAGLTSHAAIIGRELGIPVICNVTNATKLFENDQTVTIDGSTGQICYGSLRGK